MPCPFNRPFLSAFLGVGLVLSTLAATGCGGDGGDSQSGSSASGATGSTGGGMMSPVTLQFEGRLGDQVFDCSSTYPAVGMAATEVSLTDFRLYIHDIRLHRTGSADTPVELDQDGTWQFQNLVLLDFENRSGTCSNGTMETNTTVHAMVPEGQYDGISFRLGVPFELNHADASVAPSPLNLAALSWGWNGGYKFLRIDSVPAGGGPFNLHLGSTGCMGDFANGGILSCSHPNVPEIVLTGFDPETKKIAVDYAAVVAGNDVTTNLGDAPGCMSNPADPDCAAVMQRLGIDVSDGSIHSDMQALFRVE
jgi:uncharacterized repeat protein (TIGR04052 family)